MVSHAYDPEGSADCFLVVAKRNSSLELPLTLRSMVEDSKMGPGYGLTPL